MENNLELAQKENNKDEKSAAADSRQDSLPNVSKKKKTSLGELSRGEISSVDTARNHTRQTINEIEQICGLEILKFLQEEGID